MTQKSKFLLTSVYTSALALSLGMSPVWGSEPVAVDDAGAKPSSRPATPPVDADLTVDITVADGAAFASPQSDRTASPTDLAAGMPVATPDSGGFNAVVGEDTSATGSGADTSVAVVDGAAAAALPTPAPTIVVDDPAAVEPAAESVTASAAVEPAAVEPVAVEPAAESVTASAAVEPAAAASAAEPVVAATLEIDAHAEELKAALVHAIAVNPWDENGDGHVSLTEFWHHIKRMFKKTLDVNGDGEVNAKDFVAEGKKVYNNVKSIFDVNHDGHIEFTEIFLGAQNALRSAEGVVAYVRGLSGKIHTSPYFALLPANIKGPLDDLLGLMNQAADETSRGIDVGESYVGRINAALESIQGQIKHLRDGSMSLDQFIQARKEIFAYLEIVKGWEKTGDNARLIHDIEEQLAKAKAPAA